MEEASESPCQLIFNCNELLDGRSTAIAETTDGDKQGDAEVVEVSWAWNHVFGLLGLHHRRKKCLA